MDSAFSNPTLIVVLVAIAAVFSICGFVVAILYVIRSRRKSNSLEIVRELGSARAEIERLERLLREENERSREAVQRQNKENREELSGRLDTLRESLTVNFNGYTMTQNQQWENLQKRVENMGQRNEERVDTIRQAVESKLVVLQEGNEKKLDEMRDVVDRKLSRTLEERLGQSFKQVSDQLEQVYKNLGEMRSLSRDMGDIKSIFSNVKTRGTWGEVQLGALLEMMLTPDQYAANVKVRRGSDEMVEYAIQLPGPDNDGVVWLPIDSKFPMEDYERMMQALEENDTEAASQFSKAMETRVVQQARSIRDKYIHPPSTTDFAILFVPIESLFAEILRRPGLAERLQRDLRVTIAGPTTLAALLNSLRMGFKTLAIQKHSSEVWKLLGAVKKQFSTFGESLDAVEKHLNRAVKGVKDASDRTNLIQKRLERVEELPEAEAEQILSMGGKESPQQLERQQDTTLQEDEDFDME